MSLNKIHKQSFGIIGLICSLLIHGFGFYLLIEYKTKQFLSLDKKHTPILVDLKLVDNLPVVNDSKILANEKMQGQGKLKYTKNEEQHLIGETVAIADNSSQSYQQEKNKSTSATKNNSEEVEKKPTKKEQPNKPPIENTKATTVAPEQNKNIKTKKPLAIETENSTKLKFWFKKDNSLQISTTSSEQVPFYLDMKNLLSSQLHRYVNARPDFNRQFVKEDKVAVVAAINQGGQVYFKEILSPSSTQPYLNYLAKNTVNYPPRVLSTLPQEFVDSQEPELNFIFTISYTGPPLRQWWLGWDFIK